MSIDQIRLSVEIQLREFGAAYDSLDLRGKVLHLAEILTATRKLNVAVVRQSGCDATAARDRLRLYLTQYVGTTIDGIELEVVSGISEYARRLRELRVQDGYRLISGASKDLEEHLDLKPSQYRLLRLEPDKTAAHRWLIANRIRKERLSTRDKLLKFFQANVGDVVTSEELAYIAGSATEFGRRTRELRTEHGYPIATRFTGRPDLASGEYVLETLERIAEPHDRNIPKPVQEEVYMRDENKCQNCGWTREQWTRQDARFLELHHLVHHVHGGTNVASNLRVFCNVCHDGIHAGRITLLA